jgi:thiaminase/transcriptional activator TenA
MNFTDKLWNTILDIYDKIINHQFNIELMKGVLDKEKFKFYINQDALYLIEFGKALSITAGRGTDADDILQFIDFANGAIRVERSLHQGYFNKFGIVRNPQISPTCFNYTNYLLAVCSTGNYEEAIAALLPCFWIYREVGLHIAQNAAKNNIYQDWIDTYSGKDFAEAVDKMIEITEKVAVEISEKNKNKMLGKFVYSVKLEYMFWDSAYKLEEWIE